MGSRLTRGTRSVSRPLVRHRPRAGFEATAGTVEVASQGVRLATVSIWPLAKPNVPVLSQYPLAGHVAGVVINDPVAETRTGIPKAIERVAARRRAARRG